jgi:mannose-6-phosphate isomerase-like protein (cupin superfamily)
LGTSNLTIRLNAADTGGRFALLDYDIAPNFLPPQVPHGHTRESQTAYVLQGEIRFEFEDRTIDATEGAVVHIPEHCAFTWRNCTPHRARMLYVFAPAGLEKFFIDVQDVYKKHPGASPADIAPHVAALWAQYGIFS